MQQVNETTRKIGAGRGGGIERENSNSNTYKDCSLGSVKTSNKQSLLKKKKKKRKKIFFTLHHLYRTICLPCKVRSSQIVQTFWSDVSALISGDIQVELNMPLILFSLDQNVQTDRVFDLIILMAKFHIFKSKLQRENQMLTFSSTH